VQISSALGSTIGQVFKLNERRIVTLVAAGAAGGIAATFNAPIAGVMFAIEVILGDFGIRQFSTIVVSSVTASAVARAVLGNSPAFAVPAYELRSPWELPLYLGLGLIAGFGALAFMKTLYLSEDLFERWRVPPITAILILFEMTGDYRIILPLMFATVKRQRLQAAAGTKLAEFALKPGEAAVGKRLKDLALPGDCVIVSIHRGGRVIVPRGNTQLLAGDRVTALLGACPVDAVRQVLRGEQQK